MLMFLQSMIEEAQGFLMHLSVWNMVTTSQRDSPLNIKHRHLKTYLILIALPPVRVSLKVARASSNHSFNTQVSTLRDHASCTLITSRSAYMFIFRKG